MASREKRALMLSMHEIDRAPPASHPTGSRRSTCRSHALDNLDNQAPMPSVQVLRWSAVVVDELQRPRHVPSFARELGRFFLDGLRP